ncbi:MAG: SUMF1/EgtB/PvdO family nonheme iron enzyme, partial [Myxococcales bacterium]|nr:SUMF1/EgtB/PvdO family nonheme iron enzyme [Myxococcales bacterium]
HRDLKPDNIMVGAHGEVLVLDWGLAKVLGEEDLPIEEPLRGLEGRTKTRMGAISGTPAYMPPEQARGQQHRVGPWSDVYALGATLYDLLAERPPYPFVSLERVLDAVIAAEPIEPPSRVADGHPVDEELDRICLKALAPRPDDRYPDATAMAEDLAAWADGATRRERAMAVVGEARTRAREAVALDRKARLLGDAARQQLEGLSAEATEEQKGPGWDLEDEAAAVRRQADDQRLEATQLLRSALTHAPDLAEAHELLADEYHRQHTALESSGRLEDARAVESLLRAHDRGRYASYLEGRGAVTLVAEVPATVELYRYELVRRRLQPVHLRSLGTTPLAQLPLPMGSYLLELHAPGRVTTRYPVRIGRGEHWDGVPPGESEPFAIPLPRTDELGPDDVYVPAGWYWSSADHPVLSDPLPRRRLWCDGFLMRRFPVTNEEYLAFLNGLLEQGREEDALAWVPRAAPGRAGEEGQLVYGRDGSGRFELMIDAQGHSWRPRMPVVRVPWAGAHAFAREASWRLPMDLEWEKAARGVDERIYPWGSTADPSWARMGGTPHVRFGPNDVGAFPSDVSPYGLRDLGGNVYDWVADARPGDAPVDRTRVVIADTDGPQRRFRGGAWNSSPFYCRLDLRRFLHPKGADTLGFRLVRSFSRSP